MFISASRPWKWVVYQYWENPFLSISALSLASCIIRLSLDIQLYFPQTFFSLDPIHSIQYLFPREIRDLCVYLIKLRRYLAPNMHVYIGFCPFSHLWLENVRMNTPKSRELNLDLEWPENDFGKLFLIWLQLPNLMQGICSHHQRSASSPLKTSRQVWNLTLDKKPAAFSAKFKVAKFAIYGEGGKNDNTV